MKRLMWLLVILANSAFAGTLEIEKDKNYTGSAFQLGGNKMLYVEKHHEINDAAGKHIKTVTQYMDPEGKEIARRTLDFSKSHITPDFVFEDYRSGYMEGASFQAGNKIKIFHRALRTEPVMEKIIAKPTMAVIDGGFNYLVRSKFNEIVAGKIISFQFISAARLDYYQFRVRKEQEYVSKGKDLVKIILEADNSLLRLILDPITITYDKATKRIISYEGISNIPANSSKNYSVKLLYPTVGP